MEEKLKAAFGAVAGVKKTKQGCFKAHVGFVLMELSETNREFKANVMDYLEPLIASDYTSLESFIRTVEENELIRLACDARSWIKRRLNQTMKALGGADLDVGDDFAFAQPFNFGHWTCTVENARLQCTVYEPKWFSLTVGATQRHASVTEVCSALLAHRRGLAFTMALHPRLGADSHVRLDADVMGKIAALL